MPDARYLLMIPRKDNLGNKLVDVAAYAHQYLFQNLGNQGSWIERNKEGMWRDDTPETYDHLITIAPDTPEMDSGVKQLAAYIAEICNQWGLLCTKDGKNGPIKWEIGNPEFRPGQAAEDLALADPQTAVRQDPSLGPQAAPTAYGGDELALAPHAGQ